MLENIKSFLTPRGTEKRINQLKEVRQMLIIAIFGVGFAFSILVPIYMLKKAGIIESDITAQYDKNIAVMHLDEQITVPYINRILGKLEEVKKLTKEGVFTNLIIVASSPGGSPQGSDELANYLIDFQKEVPTTFYVQNLCASGCYYIAAAMKKDNNDELSGIIANTNSIVGSIGVVLPHFVYGPALEQHGFQNEYIFEGDHKVPIDSWSLVTPESKKYLKANLLAPVYETFQNFVQEHRGLSKKELEEVNGGRVFISSLVKGTLVDRISNYHTIREEIKTKVEKQYPDEEVGFVMVDTKIKTPSFLSAIFGLDDIKISIENPLAEQLTNNSLNIQ